MNPNPLNSIRLLSSLTAALLLLVNSAPAQQTVRAEFEAKGVDWILGSWTGENEQGTAIALEYEWDLDGRLLSLDLRIGDVNIEGMIVRQPTDGKLIEFAADSTGGITRSSWRIDDGMLVSERTGTGPNGETARVAVVTKKVDDDTVLATVHALTGDGEIGDDVLDTVKLTRESTAEDDD